MKFQLARKIKKSKPTGRRSSGAVALPILLRSWDSSPANLHQKETVNTMVKESCEIENGKGVIEEGLVFLPRRLCWDLPAVSGSPTIPFALIWP